MTVFLGQRVYLLHLHYCRKQPCIFDGFLLTGFVACLLFYEVGLEFLRASHQSAAVKAGIPAIPQRPWNPKKGWFPTSGSSTSLSLDWLRHVLGEGVFPTCLLPLDPVTPGSVNWTSSENSSQHNLVSLNSSDCKSHKPSSVPHSGCDKTTFIMLDLPDCSVCQSLAWRVAGSCCKVS